MQMRSSGTPAKLYITLLQNPDFKKEFAILYCDFINGIVSMDKVIPMLEDYKENYTELITYSQLRWKSYQNSKLEGYAYYKNQYLQTLDYFYKYFPERNNYTLQHMKKYLNLTREFYKLTISVNGEGKIKVNTINAELNEGKWSGTYIGDLPFTITLTAIPSKECKFKGWDGDIIGNEDKIVIMLIRNKNLIANFECSS